MRIILDLMTSGAWGVATATELARQWAMSEHTVRDRAQEAARAIRMNLEQDREAIVASAIAQLEAYSRKGLEDARYAAAGQRSIMDRLQLLRVLEPEQGRPSAPMVFSSERERLALLERLVSESRRRVALEATMLPAGPGEGADHGQEHQEGDDEEDR